MQQTRNPAVASTTLVKRHSRSYQNLHHGFFRPWSLPSFSFSRAAAASRDQNAPLATAGGSTLSNAFRRSGGEVVLNTRSLPASSPLPELRNMIRASLALGRKR